MRKLILSSAVVALFAFNSAKAADSTVVAVINGQKFTYADVMKQKETLPKELQAAPDDKLFPLLQNKLVNETVVTEAAKKSNVESLPEFKELIAKLKDQLILQTFISEKVKDVISDANVKKRYEELVKDFPQEKEGKVRHIQVKDKKTADQIVKALKNGAKFETLAKEKSEDKTTGKNGGEIGYVQKSLLPAELSDKVFALKAGEFTADPVQTELGWHIFKVDEYRDAKPPKFEEAKEKLTALMTEEAVQALITGLRTEAKVELFDANGKPMPKEEEKKEASDTKSDASKSPTGKATTSATDGKATAPKDTEAKKS